MTNGVRIAEDGSLWTTEAGPSRVTEAFVAREATGGATWNATNSTDGGNNSGWIFGAPPPAGNSNFFLLFG
jgi:hypothetical protein